MLEPTPAADDPAPLTYHRDIARHLKSAEPGMWSWFAASQQRAEDADAFRLDLLKTTYRLDAVGHPALFELTDELKSTMALRGTVSIYQSHAGEALNAALAFLPGEAHIVFAGPVLATLAPDELKALLAHELAHYQLLEGWEGEFLTAADLIRALAADASCGPEYAETARLWSLYTELYCDRWALKATGDLAAAVRTLVKAQVGLDDINAESYLRQAADIFRAGPVKAGQITHPELYIRARALELWHRQGAAAEAEIERMIQGPLGLNQLDLLAQRRASELTFALLTEVLAPAWLRTDANLAHARQFFADFETRRASSAQWGIAQTFEEGDPSLRDFGCYLLMDFATVDRDLGDAGVAAMLCRARAWGIAERFAELAQKELGHTKKAWTKLDKDAETLVKEAAQSAAAEALS
jgi:hypothetical protein